MVQDAALALFVREVREAENEDGVRALAWRSGRDLAERLGEDRVVRALLDDALPGSWSWCAVAILLGDRVVDFVSMDVIADAAVRYRRRSSSSLSADVAHDPGDDPDFWAYDAVAFGVLPLDAHLGVVRSLTEAFHDDERTAWAIWDGPISMLRSIEGGELAFEAELRFNPRFAALVELGRAEDD